MGSNRPGDEIWSMNRDLTLFHVYFNYGASFGIADDNEFASSRVPRCPLAVPGQDPVMIPVVDPDPVAWFWSPWHELYQHCR